MARYQTRRNLTCPDGWEHLMPNGTWMCGRTHGGQMRRHGGSIKKRMTKGGSIRKRRMQMGGRTDCPPGQYRRGGRCVSQQSYRKGGTVNRARKMQSGGIASATNMNYSQLSKKA